MFMFCYLLSVALRASVCGGTILRADRGFHLRGDDFLLRERDPSVAPKQNPAETDTRGEVGVEFRGSAFVFTGGLLHFFNV